MSWFRPAVFALLACNAIVFVRSGTPYEALDSAAWFALLILFDLETRFGAGTRHSHAAVAMRAIRLLAACAIAVAAAGYLRDGVWLDAINAWLWIGVVVFLEFELRRPRAVAAHATAFTAGASLLYGALAMVALAWAWRGEWFDAYDALLWLIAFATIELDVLNIARGKPAVARSGKRAIELGDKA